MNTIWFDFDGTIVDVKKRFYSVHQALCMYLNINPLTESEYWNARCNRVSTMDILRKINAEHIYDEYIAGRNELIESTKFLKMDTLRSGVVEALNQIKLRYKCKLLTGRKDKKNLDWQLKYLQIVGFFDEVFIVSPYGNWEEKYKILCNYSSPADIMVGDTPGDLLAGKSAQLKTIAVLDGMSTQSNIEATIPDYIVPFFAGIMSKIV